MNGLRIRFPLNISFKIWTIPTTVRVTDASGALILYAKQVVLSLSGVWRVFADEAETELLYRISANRILDDFIDFRIQKGESGTIANVRFDSVRSIWRARCDVTRLSQVLFAIREANPWIKVANNFIEAIPLLGVLSGFILHPAYLMTRVSDGVEVLRAVKRASLFESRFTLLQQEEIAEFDEPVAVLAILVMLLLERGRG